MIDRDELTDRRDALVQALNERSLVVQTFDCESSADATGWEAPTILEAERIADFVIDFLSSSSDPE